MKPPIQHAEPWFRNWAVNYGRRAHVSISKIRATQYYVYPRMVAKYRKMKRLPAVRLFRLDGGLWGIDNGHHRITAAVLNGRTRIWAELDLPPAAPHSDATTEVEAARNIKKD